MVRVLRGLPWRGLWLLLAHQLFLVTACQDAHYGTLMQELCLSRFQKDMEAMERTLWCDWGKTIGSYGELTDCTRNLAERLGCFWPNVEVDRFFVAVHRHYFRSCPASGRALGDPPSTILCPFVVLPITVTLLVTALVVWRSKRAESIV
ncbi:receptor activity-modifying protein 1 precursor [Cavia porcellus]|uniref:Receptor activity-modifying protein 1 n=1 Tax=Cavia porcellus TaxID=10141 RepID=RAMP1_CAVPO|nr:receptor activity-modifying protein 1 precursor [Cavia porcellus]Q8R4C6.1 RecName: Full=Receptor activity-modifying protein 1; Flags: Precursor [Cavia porcellus]AAL91558.1 receptor activity modifying protein 1 [Cavia porcellus]